MTDNILVHTIGLTVSLSGVGVFSFIIDIASLVQGKSKPFNLRDGFNKYPHVGYQNSSFLTRISMELFNFKNILKNPFRKSKKKRQAHKIHYDVTRAKFHSVTSEQLR